LLSLDRIDREFWQHLRRLEPFGIGHPAPIFWSAGCTVASQKLMRGGHLQLLLEQQGSQRRAVAWRWQGPDQVQGPLDVAYRLRLDRWQGEERLQLELLGLRSSGGDEVVLQRQQRTYWCRRQGTVLVIRNAAGVELEAPVLPGLHQEAETAVDHPKAHHPYVQDLFRDAAMALGLAV
jgi:single-stranded-DNA-specific exonuclease